eukprot:TRINITY_DN10814_c0_g1_i2.p1 TRINITY_DN10814_c0_g1~~TRINITY_DN10814_c0_g1_i2.p1  ORF type:complete len:200 (-),score=29.81 TRINITY_DN10814_c0_g1_i2:960-1559(-)
MSLTKASYLHFRLQHPTSTPSAARSLICKRVFRRSLTVANSHSEKDSMKVGFLGLGIMGSAMASNLLKAGYDVTVWNRTASKCDPLLKIGAKYGRSPENVASECDVTFSMLADPASAIEVACGKEGAVHGLCQGKGYVDASTVDGDTSRSISIAITSKDAQFLEAPVSGSKKPAEEGKLIFLTADIKGLKVVLKHKLPL